MASSALIPLAALVGAPICNLDPVGAATINHDAILMMLENGQQGTGDSDADDEQRLWHG